MFRTAEMLFEKASKNSLFSLYIYTAVDLIGTLLQVKKRKRPSVDKALCHGWLHVSAFLFFYLISFLLLPLKPPETTVVTLAAPSAWKTETTCCCANGNCSKHELYTIDFVKTST